MKKLCDECEKNFNGLCLEDDRPCKEQIYFEKGRSDAIDDFLDEIKNDRYLYYNEHNVLKVLKYEEDIEAIAEKLKGDQDESKRLSSSD